MESKFNFNEIEEKMYKNWEEKGYFKCKIDKNKDPFVVVMPPPNVTGKLHMGHALDDTIQDVFIRYNRLKGNPTLWVPGTDHASIATEVKVVEKLRKQGLSKDDLGREGFLKEAWAWKNEYGNEIKNQVRKLGASCDWSKERFTMDEVCSKSVLEAFKRLYDNGYIYRGERIVNWCPCCKTSISETEVEYKENHGHLWHIRYNVENSDEYVTIATTRPETLLGDTAVAVYPSDERYKHLVGKNVILPLVNRKIPIVADEYVEKEFGTGVVKITPAHDPNDFMVGTRHNLPRINIMNEDGTINENGGKYNGLDRYEAREKIVNDLKEIGALVKIEDYDNNVGTCYRCHTVIEPYLSLQWFVKMKELAKPAIEAVKNGEITFVPKRFEKLFFNWMENIQDWCISRQLWWGHRVPAYYCDKCDKITVSKEHIDKCECGGNLSQDEDSLDTWFSSALWPFSVMGWPDKTEELDYFYPTSTLVTGYDIITFWVSKMIFSGIKYTGKVPFKNVFIHGIVRDSEGRKMSKSLGNGIDPLEIIKDYGTDALRFSLIQNIAPGNDIKYSKERIDNGYSFVNKLWNAAKFVNMYIDKLDDKMNINFMPEDKYIITKLNNTIKNVISNTDNFEIGIALNELYSFTWFDFCDWYIEMVKPRLYKNEGELFNTAVFTLNYVLTSICKMLHPYMPFVTEEIYLNLKHEKESIMLESYPIIEYKFNNEDKFVSDIVTVITNIRNIRAENNIVNSKKIDIKVIIKNNDNNVFNLCEDFIKKLCSIENIEYVNNINNLEDYTSVLVDNYEVYLNLNDVVDKTEEINKLNIEKEKVIKEIKRAEGMLNNEKFVSKAPEKLVNEEKEKVIKYNNLLKSINEKLDKLSK